MSQVTFSSRYCSALASLSLTARVASASLAFRAISFPRLRSSCSRQTNNSFLTRTSSAPQPCPSRLVVSRDSKRTPNLPLSSTNYRFTPLQRYLSWHVRSYSSLSCCEREEYAASSEERPSVLPMRLFYREETLWTSQAFILSEAYSSLRSCLISDDCRTVRAMSRALSLSLRYISSSKAFRGLLGVMASLASVSFCQYSLIMVNFSALQLSIHCWYYSSTCTQLFLMTYSSY